MNTQLKFYTENQIINFSSQLNTIKYNKYTNLFIVTYAE